MLFLPDSEIGSMRVTIGVVVEMQFGDVLNSNAGGESEEIDHALWRVEHKDCLLV